MKSNIFHNIKKVVSETKKLIKSNYREYLVKLSESLKDNPKRFWSLHSIKTKSRRLPESVFYEGVSSRKPSKQGNLFNLHFHSESFPYPMIWYMGILIQGKSVLVALFLLQLALVKCKKILVKLNPNKAAGVDSIPARLLKCVANELANPVSWLFNSSFTRAIVPQLWK